MSIFKAFLYKVEVWLKVGKDESVIKERPVEEVEKKQTQIRVRWRSRVNRKVRPLKNTEEHIVSVHEESNRDSGGTEGRDGGVWEPSLSWQLRALFWNKLPILTLSVRVKASKNPAAASCFTFLQLFLKWNYTLQSLTCSFKVFKVI